MTRSATATFQPSAPHRDTAMANAPTERRVRGCAGVLSPGGGPENRGRPAVHRRDHEQLTGALGCGLPLPQPLPPAGADPRRQRQHQLRTRRSHRDRLRGRAFRRERAVEPPSDGTGRPGHNEPAPTRPTAVAPVDACRPLTPSEASRRPALLRGPGGPAKRSRTPVNSSARETNRRRVGAHCGMCRNSSQFEWP